MPASEILWTPSHAQIERATLTRYQRWLEQTHGLQLDGYAGLWQWSVDDLEAFWASIVEFLHISFAVPGARVLAGEAMPGAEWFPGSRLSYAEHIFHGKRD